MFGPRQDLKSEYSAVIPKFITKLLNHESPVIYGNGSQTRDFIFVKDVVQVNLRAMDHSLSGVFNVAYGNSINLIELARSIMEVLDENLPLKFEPPRSGDIQDSVANISLAQNALGYIPEYSLKTGIEETIQWYQHR